MAPKYITKLLNKRVVVVGGTSGIGLAVAEASVEYGAIVVVASSNQEKVDGAVARIQKSYPEAKDRVRGQIIDLRAGNVEGHVAALYDFATEGGKHKLDHIVNTAGDSLHLVSLDNVTPENSSGMYKVRMIGTMMLAKVAVRYLNPSPTSSFTMTSGVRDNKPFTGFAAIAPVGAAMKGLTRALANDMQPIRVNCVCPGPVKTEGFSDMAEDQLRQVLERFRSQTLTKTIGTPEDLAECYICSMKNNFMDGVEIYADGGHLLC